jgi:hypothetical protein
MHVLQAFVFQEVDLTLIPANIIHSTEHGTYASWMKPTNQYFQGLSDTGVDSGTQGWIQEHRGGFRDTGVDSHSPCMKPTNQPQLQGLSHTGVDSGTQEWIHGHRGGFRDTGVDSHSPWMKPTNQRINIKF